MIYSPEKITFISNEFRGSSQFEEQNQAHDSRLSKSKVDMQRFFQQTFPMCPTSRYRDWDSCLHNIDRQETKQLDPWLDFARNV